MHRHRLILLLILLLAFGLRVHQLTAVPPGLTHDEANHGREAIGVLDGVLLYYFPLNYGSEPLYSYTVAGSMALLGENLFALRLVNVMAGMAAIAVAYLWTRKAFNRRTALVAAGVMALIFWPLASSREALRAGMLPLFMGGAVWFYWRLVVDGTAVSNRQRWAWTAAFGLCVAITLHIYLAARVAWLLFPLFVGWLALTQRQKVRQMALPTIAGLLLAGLLVLPMFLYLQAHPEALTRLDMLDGPLLALRQGDLRPVMGNVAEALLAFVWPGTGDEFLAYNIPGRPVFDGITAVFFIIGLLVSLWRWRQPNHALLLLWFGVGIIPSLITGSTANTTRNLAALIPAMVLPAVGFWFVADCLRQQLSVRTVAVAAAGWLAIAGFITARDYFGRWAPDPDVRSAYQTTTIAMLDHLETAQPTAPVVISSVYPGPAHDPSIALVLAPQLDLRWWVDARLALLFPDGGGGTAVIPQSTPPHPAFAAWLTPQQTVDLRVTDLDPSFTIYDLAAPDAAWLNRPTTTFGEAVTLLHAAWLQADYQPGDIATMITVWRVEDPAKAGPLVPPAYSTDAVIFTQVLTDEAQVLTQQDRLDAPSWGWQVGDVFVQVHEMVVPETAVSGDYRTIIGIYDRASGVRLPVTAGDNVGGDTFARVHPLRITNR